MRVKKYLPRRVTVDGQLYEVAPHGSLKNARVYRMVLRRKVIPGKTGSDGKQAFKITFELRRVHDRATMEKVAAALRPAA